MAAQANCLDNNISLSVCMHHAAYGQSIVIRRWSEISRAASMKISPPPFDIGASLDISPVLMAGANDDDVKHTVFSIAKTAIPKDPSNGPNFPAPSELPTMKTAIFGFKANKIAEDEGTIANYLREHRLEHIYISSNDALRALLWHAVSRAQLSKSYQ